MNVNLNKLQSTVPGYPRSSELYRSLQWVYKALKRRPRVKLQSCTEVEKSRTQTADTLCSRCTHDSADL